MGCQGGGIVFLVHKEQGRSGRRPTLRDDQAPADRYGGGARGRYLCSAEVQGMLRPHDPLDALTGEPAELEPGAFSRARSDALRELWRPLLLALIGCAFVIGICLVVGEPVPRALSACGLVLDIIGVYVL